MISDEKRARLNERQFFGRRKGPGLSPRQQGLIDDLYPKIGLSKPEKRPGALDPKALFGPQFSRFALEIGFGKGEHLAHQAIRQPDTGFFGCEPYINGLVGFLDTVAREGLGNVRVYDDDARDLIDALPDGSLDMVYLLHPDPWHKRRHAKRRFVNPHNLDALARILRRGGELRIVTDDPVYRQWTAMRMSQRSDFDWLAESPKDWRTAPDDWLFTRYALKADREGRWDCYFRYRRL
ncbi:tRNA (guanine-N(7)-)-methyltransferase [Iodidimonas gelatinilytica]|uniref:tRNA (guanine-N(7)-)-methyltransferase n=1 Tax=Iodidimonas gelatinilytica TaxID=1236966 RepID=A0A5A7N374_9PROT|nr:tRNA (guanine(46)-N(7))-methyltransferase TrmB [Iodidimonas gelatinilytica]GEQ97424.1 tRNA (guanine-N(7)-)-methyltransferase [Iodidimonas gelatinilytica]GER02135.1 tRNA (guanine-N(7)-)-methyltransferase [Iodidimonas gelatinilytica]